MNAPAATEVPDPHSADPALVLGWYVRDLAQRGYPLVGGLRAVARRLATQPADHPDGCPGCGGQVLQPATGRRRIWCSEACRSRTRRR